MKTKAGRSVAMKTLSEWSLAEKSSTMKSTSVGVRSPFLLTYYSMRFEDEMLRSSPKLSSLCAFLKYSIIASSIRVWPLQKRGVVEWRVEIVWSTDAGN